MGALTTETIRVRFADAYGNYEDGLEDFDLWLADHDAGVRASVMAAEPEWDYGVGWDWAGRVAGFRSGSREEAEAFVARSPVDDEGEPYYVVRRASPNEPGEWVKL